MDYDLLVIGEERQGIDRAIASARLGHRVAVIKSAESIPSLELMRIAASNVSAQGEVTMASWRAEVAQLTDRQSYSLEIELQKAGVEQIFGQVRFVSSTEVEVWGRDERRAISSRETVLACGTRSRLPATLRSDDRFVFSVESLLAMKDMPRTMTIVGGGDQGLSAAIMLATLGIEVTVVDEHMSLLELCGLFEARFDAVQALNIAFRLDDEVIGTEIRPDLQAGVRLASGRVLVADAVLVCVGCEGKTDSLNLEAIGVGVDERGRVWCDNNGRTWSAEISAVGPIVGFPRRRATPNAHFASSRFALLGQASSYDLVGNKI